MILPSSEWALESHLVPLASAELLGDGPADAVSEDRPGLGADTGLGSFLGPSPPWEFPSSSRLCGGKNPVFHFFKPRSPHAFLPYSTRHRGRPGSAPRQSCRTRSSPRASPSFQVPVLGHFPVLSGVCIIFCLYLRVLICRKVGPERNNY